MNDYTGKLLHDEHYGDLLREARGGWMIKAARQAGEPQQTRSPKRRLVLRLVQALMAALLGSLVVTSAFEPRIGASTAGGGTNAFSEGHSVAR